MRRSTTLYTFKRTLLQNNMPIIGRYYDSVCTYYYTIRSSYMSCIRFYNNLLSVITEYRTKPVFAVHHRLDYRHLVGVIQRVYTYIYFMMDQSSFLGFRPTYMLSFYPPSIAIQYRGNICIHSCRYLVEIRKLRCVLLTVTASDDRLYPQRI